jgi:hypothetical protein
VLIVVLDGLYVVKMAPWVLSLMLVDFSPEALVKLLEVAPVEACDALEILKKLDTPITRIVLSLVLDVVAALAVPRTHTDIF